MVACVVSPTRTTMCGILWTPVSAGFDFTGSSRTVASFIGFDSYIQSYKIKTKEVVLNANRKQGYWGFETTVSAGGFTMEDTLTGRAPPGATTVPNPIFPHLPYHKVRVLLQVLLCPETYHNRQ